MSNEQLAQIHYHLLALYKRQQDTYHLSQESCETSLSQAMSQHHLSEQAPEHLLPLKYHSPYSASQDGPLQYDQYAPLLILLEHHLLKRQSAFDDKRDYNYLKLSDVKFEKIASIKQLEPQHVYDLAIEGTRNFIANDIVAHNTYLATSSGNVGIGTTSPDNLLTISGNEITSNAILHLNASDNFNTSVKNVLALDHVLKSPVNSTGGVGVSILFRANDNASQLYNIGNISAILYNSTNGSQLGALTFSTSGADTGDGSFGHSTERMRVDGSGRVGINTTNPFSTLEISGTFNATSNSGAIRVDSEGNVKVGI